MRPLLLLCTLILAGCATGKASPTLAPLTLVDRLDLTAFMGDWHVIGNLPTSAEEGCHNALEQYALRDDGKYPTRGRQASWHYRRSDGTDGEVGVS